MNIPLHQIQTDPHNPRKNFDVARLAELKDSIKKRGIRVPLIVEKISEHKYQLIDGERRFRVATELKLKEVPVVIENTLNEIDRLVVQFHIQEQHENWSGAEKAMALLRLSEEGNMKFEQLCETIGIQKRTVSRYLAFSQIINKDIFIEKKIPVEWGSNITSVINKTRNLYQDEVHKTFTRDDENKLEKSILNRIFDGEIKNRTEIVKIKDIFVKDPKSIRKFIDDRDVSLTELYASTGAKGAYALRNVRNNASFLTQHARAFLKVRDVKIDEGTLAQLKGAQECIKKLIALAE